MTNARALKCPKCSYDLTGLTINRCPECGGVFDPVALAWDQSCHRPRWWMALLAVLFCAYAPFALWIPFQSQAIWFKLWVILPGFFVGMFWHPNEPLEFIIMSVVTLIVLVGGTWLASRRWWLFGVVCVFLLLGAGLNAWGSYAVSRV